MKHLILLFFLLVYSIATLCQSLPVGEWKINVNQVVAGSVYTDDPVRLLPPSSLSSSCLLLEKVLFIDEDIAKLYFQNGVSISCIYYALEDTTSEGCVKTEPFTIFQFNNSNRFDSFYLGYTFRVQKKGNELMIEFSPIRKKGNSDNEKRTTYERCEDVSCLGSLIQVKK